MIHFNHQEFQSLLLYSEKFGEILIASEELNKVIISLKGDYINKEAQILDEQIFYFVPDNYFTLSDDEFVQKIESEII